MNNDRRFFFATGVVVRVINGRITSPKSVCLIDTTDGRKLEVPQNLPDFLRQLHQADSDTFSDMMEALDPQSEEFKKCLDICSEHKPGYPCSIEEEYNP